MKTTGIKVKTLVRKSSNVKYTINVWENERLTTYEIDYCQKENIKDYGMVKYCGGMTFVPKRVLEAYATTFNAGADYTLEIACKL